MKELLCQLSYKGILGWTAELESATSWATTRRSNPTELRPHGDYDGTRTHGLQRDRLALFATELHSHNGARAHFRTCGSGSGKTASPKHWHDQLLQYLFSTHHKTNSSLEALFFCVFGEYLTRVPGDPLLTLSSD